MNLKCGLLTMAVAAAALSAGSAMAQNGDRQSSTEYYRSTTVINRQAAPADGITTDQYQRAAALHAQATRLAHRATRAAQSGNRTLAAQLAAQAQTLFNRSFQLTHPGNYAHRRGE